MKLSIPGILLLTGTVAATCFTSLSKDRKFFTSNPISDRLIPGNHAKAAIRNWDSLCKTIGIPENLIIRSFKISDTDLLDALNIPRASVPPHTYKSVRVYLGLEPIYDTFKLYVVPVDTLTNADLMFDSTCTPFKKPPGHYDNLINKYVMDLNAPCPNLCDLAVLSSPLMDTASNPTH